MRAQDVRDPAASAEGDTAAPAAPASDTQTSFSSAGALPPVAAPAGTAGPTASDRAFGPAEGPGLKALDALLAAGTPDVKKIVDLLDAHRDEHAAILARVEDKLGAAYAHQVEDATGHLRASIPRKEVVAGDPGDPNSGYFIASAADKGARWRTSGGGFTGTANKDGLDTRVKLGADDALHGHVGKDKTGTLGWEHDGRVEGELYGSYKDGKDYEAGLRRTDDVGGGKLTEGVRHTVAGGTATDAAYGSYKSGDGKTTADASLGVRGGHAVESVSGSHTFASGDQLSGSLAHDDKGTTVSANETHPLAGGARLTGSAQVHHGADGTTTGSLGGTYTDGATHAAGNVTRAADRTSLHLDGGTQVAPNLTVNGHLDDVEPDKGGRETTLGVSERYRSPNMVNSLDLEAGHGTRDYFKSTGSADAHLGGNLYGGAWGSYEKDSGHQASAQAGASLTLTTSEKTALTLAGVIDQNGSLETRLQYDIFKQRIENVGDLADHKKDALVSLFLSYQHGNDRHMLDDRFGAPQMGTEHGLPGGDQVTAGIRIKF